MKINQIEAILRTKRGYYNNGRLKKGVKWLSKHFNVTEDQVVEAIQNIRNDSLETTAVARVKTKHKIKRLFFDIETSPNLVYAWRIGYNLTLDHNMIVKERAIISVAYKWEGDSTVHCITWDKNQCDKSLLEEFIKVLHTADEIVAHNGKKFDEKWLRTRCIYHGIPTFPKYKSIDTLTKARSGFNFNSNKLDYIAKFLKVGAKLHHEGFDMWKKIIEKNDKTALETMCQYNKIDVIVLEDVFNAIKNYIVPETHVGVLNNKEKYSCASCGSYNLILYKNVVTSKGTIQRVMQCLDCGSFTTLSNTSYNQYLKSK